MTGVDRAVSLPRGRTHYILKNAHVPLGCLKGVDHDAFHVCIDRLAIVDIEINNGKIAAILPAGSTHVSPFAAALALAPTAIDLRGKMILPTFVDLHTHIDKSHTTERTRNPDGSLTGADRSTAADAAFWDADDVFRRMDFSVKCAYAHGTSAIRTHLINMAEKQRELTWPAFDKLREKWRGKVELQAVSLVVLSFYRDEAAAIALADTVAAHGGLLGAAVCCAERGGDPQDDWTTCERDRDELLELIFTLAKERNLDLDFHTDENGNELAKGLRYVAEKTIKFGYQGRVVCGHCCSLAFQPPEELQRTLSLVREAGITVVSLPLVNQWTQDRDPLGKRTPKWRGVTLLHETAAARVPVAMASDNVRDQFFAYADLDCLEVFNQGCRIAHLDRPYGDWIRAVTSTPADAMRLPQPHGRLAPGVSADFIIFRARRYSELLARPQIDRVVIRNGRAIDAIVPDYSELDYVPLAIKTGQVPVASMGYANGEGEFTTRVGGITFNSGHTNGWQEHGNGGLPSRPRDVGGISWRGGMATIAGLMAVIAALLLTNMLKTLHVTLP